TIVELAAEKLHQIGEGEAAQPLVGVPLTAVGCPAEITEDTVHQMHRSGGAPPAAVALHETHGRLTQAAADDQSIERAPPNIPQTLKDAAEQPAPHHEPVSQRPRQAGEHRALENLLLTGEKLLEDLVDPG